MKIVLGSTSDSKKEILTYALKDLSLGNIDILGVDAKSEISDQPLDEETTVRGAINRAKNALGKNEQVDFSVGLEGGLHEINNDGYFLICAAAIYDKHNHLAVGTGGKLKLPKEVSDRVKNGDQFGEAIRDYESKYKDDQDAMFLIGALISRKESFKQAIQNAYLSYKNKNHFI